MAKSRHLYVTVRAHGALNRNDPFLLRFLHHLGALLKTRSREDEASHRDQSSREKAAHNLHHDSSEFLVEIDKLISNVALFLCHRSILSPWRVLLDAVGARHD